MAQNHASRAKRGGRGRFLPFSPPRWQLELPFHCWVSDGRAVNAQIVLLPPGTKKLLIQGPVGSDNRGQRPRLAQIGRESGPDIIDNSAARPPAAAVPVPAGPGELAARVGCRTAAATGAASKHVNGRSRYQLDWRGEVGAAPLGMALHRAADASGRRRLR